jgi:predicted nuclease of predicted toxin-antitoxin system
LLQAKDERLGEAAPDQGAVIVSKDADFVDLVQRH